MPLPLQPQNNSRWVVLPYYPETDSSLFVAILVPLTDKDSAMDIVKKHFGTLPGGKNVELFTLSNGKGMEVDIINYGGIITAIRIPDKHKEPGDVVLGFDTLEEYLGEHPYFGAIVGRFANRIEDGKFELDGTTYQLARNNDGNHLHGGLEGFDKKHWTASVHKTLDDVTLKLGYESQDMEEGFPGNLMTEVNYTLNRDNELIISYRATTDRNTHLNLTNHSYFNLNNQRGTILDHELMIDAEHYTPFKSNSIPDGSIKPVAGTPYDFRIAKTIGEDIEKVSPGYDNNLVAGQPYGEMKRLVALHHPGTGRTMEVLTTQPGIQLYTSNFIDRIPGKDGMVYKKHSAVCLETQHFPNTPNEPSFPSTLLKPGEVFEQVTIYRFTW